MIRPRTATLSALGVLGMVVILARLPGLGALGLMQYNWFGRVENFTDAIGSGRFADTYQIPHPGVTLMWIIGGVLTTARAVTGPITGADRVWFFELAQVIWAFVVVLLLFIVLRRVLIVYGESSPAAEGIAFTACLLIALDPLVVTMTRAVSLDGPLSLHAALAVGLFLTALQTRRTLDELLAGVAAGVTVLTKLPGLIFVFGMGFWLLVRAWRDRGSNQISRSLRSLFLIPAAAAITFVLVWPAMWVAPLHTLGQIAATPEQAAQIERGDLAALLHARSDQRGADALLDVVLHPHKADDAGVVYGRLRSAWQYYPAVILFKTPPATLLFAAAGAVLALTRWRQRPPDATLALLGHMLLFALLYFLCMSIAAKKTWRYMVTVEVFLEIAAGLTAAWLMRLAWHRRRRWAAAMVALLLALQSASVLACEPHLLTYYNPLLGGRSVAEQYVLIDWGDGVGEAARYMRDHARRHPIRFVAQGMVAPRLQIMIGDAQYVAPVQDAEFFVIDYRQFLRGVFPPPADLYWRSRRPEHVVWIRGVPHMWIYRVDQHDAAGS